MFNGGGLHHIQLATAEREAAFFPPVTEYSAIYPPVTLLPPLLILPICVQSRSLSAKSPASFFTFFVEVGDQITLFEEMVQKKEFK